MALPDSNISVTMVKSELGASTNDVGQLCIHPNINKWSKRKPVRHTSVSPLTEAQLQGTHYGLQLYELDAIEDILSANVEYLKPRGGNSEPFRLTDFIGYTKDATIPLGTGSTNNDIFALIRKRPSPMIESFPVYTGANVIGAIDYADLYSGLGNIYLGVYMTNGGQSVWFTNPDPLPSSGMSVIYVYVDMGLAPMSDWTGITSIHYFLTNARKTQDGVYVPSTTDRFYPLTTDSSNLNPVFYNIHWGPISEAFSATVLNFNFLEFGYQAEMDVVFSTIGSYFTGGEVRNAKIEFYSNSDYTGLTDTKNIGTFNIGSEEEISFPITAVVPFNATAYYQVIVDNEVIISRAEFR